MALKKKAAETSAMAPDVQHDVLLAELQAIVDDEADPRNALALIRRRLELETSCCTGDVPATPIGALRSKLSQPVQRPYSGQVDPDSGLVGQPSHDPDRPSAAVEGAEAKTHPIATTESMSGRS